jgi:hypothetical protein
MLFQNQVVRTIGCREPRAIAIVLGHLGCSSEELAGYGRMYSERKCTVITATSPIIRFVMNMRLRSTAREILTQATVALQGTPSHVPVVIHAFSNGGTFLLEEIEKQLLHQQQRQKFSASSDENFSLFASRLRIGYQFFDSCPCYIRPIWDWAHWSGSFPHPQLSVYSRMFYTAVASFSLTIWCTSTLSWHRPRQFWNFMAQSNLCPYQIFMYTTTDLLSDAAAVDRFINIRRAQGIRCNIYRYNDSNHCQLHKDHPIAYGQAIDDSLERQLSSKNQPIIPSVK